MESRVGVTQMERLASERVTQATVMTTTTMMMMLLLPVDAIIVVVPPGHCIGANQGTVRGEVADVLNVTIESRANIEQLALRLLLSSRVHLQLPRRQQLQWQQDLRAAAQTCSSQQAASPGPHREQSFLDGQIGAPRECYRSMSSDADFSSEKQLGCLRIEPSLAIQATPSPDPNEPVVGHSSCSCQLPYCLLTRAEPCRSHQDRHHATF